MRFIFQLYDGAATSWASEGVLRTLTVTRGVASSSVPLQNTQLSAVERNQGFLSLLRVSLPRTWMVNSDENGGPGRVWL